MKERSASMNHEGKKGTKAAMFSHAT